MAHQVCVAFDQTCFRRKSVIAARQAGGDGVQVGFQASAPIGGATAGAGNVISGNIGDGIRVNYPGQGTGGTVEILGNRIGTSAAGTKGIPNANGIETSYVGDLPATVRVGMMLDGTTPVRVPNTIAYNHAAGVRAPANQGVNPTITKNHIYANKGLGIDLGGAGVTQNDQGDGDYLQQNFPLLTSASVANGKVAIAGSFNSKPNESYRIEFFGSPRKDASGYGEGRAFLGAANVTTGAAGNATINASFRFKAVASNWVTATATNADGNTSEFSRAAVLSKP